MFLLNLGVSCHEQRSLVMEKLNEIPLLETGQKVLKKNWPQLGDLASQVHWGRFWIQAPQSSHWVHPQDLDHAAATAGLLGSTVCLPSTSTLLAVSHQLPGKIPRRVSLGGFCPPFLQPYLLRSRVSSVCPPVFPAGPHSVS